MHTDFSGSVLLAFYLSHQVGNLSLQSNDIVDARKIYVKAGRCATSCRQFALHMPQLQAQLLQLRAITCGTAPNALNSVHRPSTCNPASHLQEQAVQSTRALCARSALG